MKKLFGIFLFILLLSACRERTPVISSIDPRIGRLGDLLTIQGRGFGNERSESYVSIGGIVPTSSSYISWSNREIMVRIPEFGEAGLVYVHRGRSRSNPALFANTLLMPVMLGGSNAGNGPSISSVVPPSGPIGSLITINGSGFGSSRENSGVFFPWHAGYHTAGPGELIPAGFVEVSEAEFGYELWSDREIHLRVPDGAISGYIELRGPRGNSRPYFFEITGMPGTKVFRDRRTYTISYTADFRIQEAASPNALYVWMPQPVHSASQPNVRLLSRNMEPFVENHRGTSLFQITNTSPRTNRGITLSYAVEVYAVETEIQSPLRPSGPSPLRSAYTRPSELIPSDEAAIKSQAAQIIGREQSPYLRASLIYKWLISSVNIQTGAFSGGVLEALQERQADSYNAALLFSALARSADIPAMPVAGVLINRHGESSLHYWVELWLDGFGWIPVDPALGAGAAPPDFNLQPDHAEFYFANMDNQRLAFSRGEVALTRMTPQGRTAGQSRSFSLQNIWEEASGGLASYSSSWSDVIITGMYVQ